MGRRFLAASGGLLRGYGGGDYGGIDRQRKTYVNERQQTLCRMLKTAQSLLLYSAKDTKKKERVDNPKNPC